jgi:hypothetical protein
LRSKQRGGAAAGRIGQKQSYPQEMKELGKRNVQIKRSFDIESKGVTLNPSLFDNEAVLLRHCKHSKV